MYLLFVASSPIQCRCMNAEGNWLPLPHLLLTAGQLKAIGQILGSEKEEASFLWFQLSKSACSETGLQIFTKKRS